MSDDDRAVRDKYKVGKTGMTQKELLADYLRHAARPRIIYWFPVNNHHQVEAGILRKVKDYREINPNGNLSEWVTMPLEQLKQTIDEYFTENPHYLATTDNTINNNNMIMTNNNTTNSNNTTNNITINNITTLNENTQQYICPTCERNFVNQYTLQRHIDKPNKCHPKPQCPRCKKSFKHPSDLQKHLARKTPCIEISNQDIELHNRELDIEEKKIELDTEIRKIELDIEKQKIELERERLAQEKERLEYEKELKRERLEHDKELKREQIAHDKDLEYKRLEFKTKKIEATVKIEEAKSLRKSQSSKTINIGTINNYYVTNYTETARDAITGISLEESMRIATTEPMMYAVIKYLYDNPNYLKYLNIGCLDKSGEAFKCHIDGEWKVIRGLENIRQHIEENSRCLLIKILNNIVNGYNHKKITNEEYMELGRKVEKQEIDLRKKTKIYESIIIDALPQETDLNTKIIPTSRIDAE